MKRLMLPMGPLVAVAVALLLRQSGFNADVMWTAAITSWTALWWIFEPIPIPATSLIPLSLLPMVGVLTPAEVGSAYGSPLILLLLGGFMLSSAMERSGAHRRIALSMVRLFGGASSRRLVFGFMAAAAFLSMWISNTATTLMLLPIVLAILERVDDERLSVSLLLGVAYAASVGGTGTPVGTPPNLIFMEVYGEVFRDQPDRVVPTFLDWMKWAVPIVLLMVPCVGLWLTRGLARRQPIELPPVGRWRAEEIRTLAVFAVTATLWITRKEPSGGWSGLLDLPQANDASVALAAVVVMFLVPNGRGERLLDWETCVRIPWGILLLFGSGIAIAKAFGNSGLSAAIGAQLAGLGQLHPLLLLLLICLAVTFLTEITSNTATTNLLMPILAAAAISANMEPKLIMVPAAISASFAFMLPVATGPNAVVFGSERLTVRMMAREGFVLNLIGAAIISVACYFIFG